MRTAESTTTRELPRVASADVVEMSLLLPANRADELIELSSRMQTTVAQLLRSWIDRGLADAR
jgi:hypothetical protein